MGNVVMGNVMSVVVLVISLAGIDAIINSRRIADSKKKLITDIIAGIAFCGALLTSIHYVNLIPIESDYIGYGILAVYGAAALAYGFVYLKLFDLAAVRRRKEAEAAHREWEAAQKEKWDRIFREIDLHVNKTSE